jgi:hypothetical protein
MEVSGQLHLPCRCIPVEEPPVATGYETGWVSELVAVGGRRLRIPKKKRSVRSEFSCSFSSSRV